MKHIAIAVLLSLAAVPALAEAPPLVETPGLAGAVASGTLPPVEQRVPGEPAIGDKPAGRPGGELHILMSGAKDTRLMVVYGYARLVGYTPELTFAQFSTLTCTLGLGPGITVVAFARTGRCQSLSVDLNPL